MDSLFDKENPTPYEILRDAAGELSQPMDWGTWLRRTGYLRTLSIAMRKVISVDGQMTRLADMLHAKYANACKILGVPPVLLTVLFERSHPNGQRYPKWCAPPLIAAMTLLEMLTNSRCGDHGEQGCEILLADRKFLKPLNDELYHERNGILKFRLRAHADAQFTLIHNVEMVPLPEIPLPETSNAD